jgi:hypothetical protein
MVAERSGVMRKKRWRIADITAVGEGMENSANRMGEAGVPRPWRHNVRALARIASRERVKEGCIPSSSPVKYR